MVTDTKTAKPRGYAFIEYEHERDMRCKYMCILYDLLYSFNNTIAYEHLRGYQL